jgi:hypothetical protein
MRSSAPARLVFWTGLLQAENFVSGFELATLREKFHALKSLQNVAFGGDGACSFETAMLGHDK